MLKYDPAEKIKEGVTLGQVVQMLKKSDQHLVFLDSTQVPLRKLMGKSHRDKEMHKLYGRLKELGVIESGSGFASLADGYPTYTYLTGFYLADSFYEEHCKPRHYVQLKLF